MEASQDHYVDEDEESECLLFFSLLIRMHLAFKVASQQKDSEPEDGDADKEDGDKGDKPKKGMLSFFLLAYKDALSFQSGSPAKGF